VWGEGLETFCLEDLGVLGEGLRSGGGEGRGWDGERYEFVA
jgi:hypothetical protein